MQICQHSDSSPSAIPGQTLWAALPLGERESCCLQSPAVGHGVSGVPSPTSWEPHLVGAIPQAWERRTCLEPAPGRHSCYQVMQFQQRGI